MKKLPKTSETSEKQNEEVKIGNFNQNDEQSKTTKKTDNIVQCNPCGVFWTISTFFGVLNGLIAIGATALFGKEICKLSASALIEAVKTVFKLSSISANTLQALQVLSVLGLLGAAFVAGFIVTVLAIAILFGIVVVIYLIGKSIKNNQKPRFAKLPNEIEVEKKEKKALTDTDKSKNPHINSDTDTMEQETDLEKEEKTEHSTFKSFNFQNLQKKIDSKKENSKKTKESFNLQDPSNLKKKINKNEQLKKKKKTKKKVKKTKKKVKNNKKQKQSMKKFLPTPPTQRSPKKKEER